MGKKVQNAGIRRHDYPFQPPRLHSIQETTVQTGVKVNERIAQHRRGHNPGFTQYRRVLHRFLLRRLKNTEDVADLAQEVYLRLLRVENEEMVRSPQDYLFGIASHVVYQFRMREQRELVSYDSEAVDQAAENPHEVWPDEMPDRLNLEREIEAALAALSPAHQAAFVLRKRDGLTDAQIAQRLQLSVHTVKKYIFQAMAQIRVQRELQKEQDHG